MGTQERTAVACGTLIVLPGVEVDESVGRGVGVDVTFWVGGSVLVGRIQGVAVWVMPVAVMVGVSVCVGVRLEAVPVAVESGAGGRRMAKRVAHRLIKRTKLRHPIMAVPARLDFCNLLSALIPLHPLR